MTNLYKLYNVNGIIHTQKQFFVIIFSPNLYDFLSSGQSKGEYSPAIPLRLSRTRTNGLVVKITVWDFIVWNYYLSSLGLYYPYWCEIDVVFKHFFHEWFKPAVASPRAAHVHDSNSEGCVAVTSVESHKQPAMNVRVPFKLGHVSSPHIYIYIYI